MGRYGIFDVDDLYFQPNLIKSPIKLDSRQSITPAKQTFGQINEKVSELEIMLKETWIEDEEEFIFSKEPQIQTKAIQNTIELLKKKNEEMKRQVSKCIQDVNDRKKFILKAEEEERQKIIEEIKAKEQLLQEKKDQEMALAAKQQRDKKEQEERIENEKKMESLLEKEMKTIGKEVLQSADQKNHFASSDALEVYEILVKKIASIKTQRKMSMSQNQQLQNTFFVKKMTITQRVGQLTNSVEKVKEIAVALNNVFSEGHDFSSFMGEWLMDFAAKAIVKQAQKEVSVKKDMAFPLAYICVLLYRKHTAFLDILLGRLMKKCSYIAGVYIKKKEAQANDDYMIAVGYRKNENGEFETEIQYGERMCGIMALYSAILQTQPKENIHNMKFGWIWFSRMLNMKPRKITPLLIHTFLEIAGHELIKAYQAQAKKLVYYLISIYFQLIPEKAIAAKTRLQLFLEETFLKTGMIPPMDGYTLS